VLLSVCLFMCLSVCVCVCVCPIDSQGLHVAGSQALCWWCKPTSRWWRYLGAL